jgi:hypothetical protein
MMNLKLLFRFGCLLLAPTTLLANNSSTDLPATLIGRAILPAASFANGPTSGTKVGKVPIINGVTLPFVNKQPVQGFSAVLAIRDGTFLVMSDNGFGKKKNSADYHLRVYRIRPYFKTKDGGVGKITVESFFELNDPHHLVPFTIINETTEKRILTGADFDIESFQKAPDDTFWFGDEFGPFLLHTDAQGVLLDAPISLPDFDNPGKEMRTPQNPYRGTVQGQVFRIKNSGGFEGMAITSDGSKLIPLLEKPLIDSEDKTLLMHEFDIASKRYTGVRYKYPLDTRASSIGDFILFAPDKGLVIERDNSRGHMNGFKMIYQVTLNGDGKWVDKTAIVNLLKIADPYHLSKPGKVGDVGIGKTFGFPFFTIEGVVLLGKNQIGVLNDNNYPFSVGRHVGSGEPDDNEFIIIEIVDSLL